MADYKVTDSELTSVANAIRTKGGTQAQLEWPTGFTAAIQAIPSGGGSSKYEEISPEYFGLSYGYNTNGQYWSSESNNNTLAYYDLEPGDYVVFMGPSVSNRFRVMLYDNRTYENDFKSFAETPQTNMARFSAYKSVNGSDDSWYILERYYFNISVNCCLVIGTSNQSTIVAPVVLKINS